MVQQAIVSPHALQDTAYTAHNKEPVDPSLLGPAELLDLPTSFRWSVIAPPVNDRRLRTELFFMLLEPNLVACSDSEGT